MPEGYVASPTRNEASSAELPKGAARGSLPTAAILAAVLAAGALLRFYAIGRKSLWLDEAVTLTYVAECRYTEMLAVVIERDAHPPLYYALIHLWMQRSAGAAWARAFSAVAGVATLVAFWLLARVLLPRGAHCRQWAPALAATALLAASAFHVYFAQEARHYALAAFFVTLSWYFFVELLAGRRLEHWRGWLGVALANAAALYTFYYTALAIAAQLVVLLLLWRDVGRKLVASWLWWQLLPAALFALQVPAILDHLARLRVHEPPTGLRLASDEGLLLTASQFTCGFIGKLGGSFGAVAAAAAAALGVLALLAGVAGARERRSAAAVALAWLLVPVALLALLPLRGHVYEPKHLIAASPALALLPAIGMASARRIVRTLSAALVALLLAANALSLALYYGRRVEKENWRSAIAEMMEDAAPNDIVVFNPPSVHFPFHYYYRPHRQRLPVLKIEAPAKGEPFRAGELNLGRRVWVLEGRSNVERPNPLVRRALEGEDPAKPLYPKLLERSYQGLVGEVTVSLYDTFRPASKGEKPAPGRRRAP